MRAVLPRPRLSRADLPSLGLIASLLALAGCSPAPGASIAASAAHAPAQVAPLAHTASDALPARLVVHALYVSIIDDDEPPRFAAPDRADQCGEQTTVAVDGMPMQPGEPVPGPVFRLSWRIDGCRPLGDGGPLLSGHYEVLVMHDDEHGPGAVLLAHDPLGGPTGASPIASRAPALSMTAR